jgi:hypothetical protein
MPGVVEVERRTKLIRDQKARRADHEELLRLVKEGRIHEADERQLETLKLAIELNELIERRSAPITVPTDEIAQAVKDAVKEGFANAPAPTGVAPTERFDPERPQMRHVSLTDVKHEDEELDVQGEVEGEEKTTDGEAKLEKLRRLKGRG